MSNWASPIVVVPKKSAPREPTKRRLCIDFRKVNELQQEVLAGGKKRGQILLHPLPKIDEMYAKLKGAKVFSTITSEADITTLHWVRTLGLRLSHHLVSMNSLWFCLV